MAKPAVTVHGADEVAAALRKVAATAADLRAPGEAAGAIVVREIARRTPRRTSRLAGSWRVTAYADRAIVATDVRYAGPVETGVPRRGMAGAHMAAEGAAAAEPAIGEPYEKAVSDGASRAGF